MRRCTRTIAATIANAATMPPAAKRRTDQARWPTARLAAAIAGPATIQTSVTERQRIPPSRSGRPRGQTRARACVPARRHAPCWPRRASRPPIAQKHTHQRQLGDRASASAQMRPRSRSLEPTPARPASPAQSRTASPAIAAAQPAQLEASGAAASRSSGQTAGTARPSDQRQPRQPQRRHDGRRTRSAPRRTACTAATDETQTDPGSSANSVARLRRVDDAAPIAVQASSRARRRPPAASTSG